MSVEELEKAVAELPPDKLAKFVAWFEAFEAARFDAKLERDAANGKLDKLVEKSEAEFSAGRYREL